MSWKNIVKADTLQSVAKEVEDLFRSTDWRTFMSDRLSELDEKIDSMSKKEIEDLRELSTRLYPPQIKQYENLIDKLLELKE